MFLIGNIKTKSLSGRILTIIVITTLSLTLLTISVLMIKSKEISISDDGQVKLVKTFKTTVEKLLVEQGIEIEREDYIYPEIKSKLKKVKRIEIKRAFPIKILDGGNELTVKMYQGKVGEALKQANVILNGKDQINYQLEDDIFKDIEIDIIRVTERIEDFKEAIPFQTITRANNNMDRGKTKVVQEGIPGEIEKKYSITIHNGEEVSRDIIEENIITEAKNEIKEYGTIAMYKPSRSEAFRYKQVLDMKATAYDLSFASCGKRPGDPGYGITATGLKASNGIVAVDPKLIPLHSRLYIEGIDGSWTYGHAIAGDVGGGVKGGKIDLFFENSSQARAFGVKQAKVYILE